MITCHFFAPYDARLGLRYGMLCCRLIASSPTLTAVAVTRQPAPSGTPSVHQSHGPDGQVGLQDLEGEWAPLMSMWPPGPAGPGGAPARKVSPMPSGLGELGVNRKDDLTGIDTGREVTGSSAATAPIASPEAVSEQPTHLLGNLEPRTYGL